MAPNTKIMPKKNKVITIHDDNPFKQALHGSKFRN